MDSDLFIPVESCLGTFIQATRLDSIIRSTQRAKVPILMYHSICCDNTEGDSCLSLAGMSVHVKTFREHMEYVAEKYCIVPLPDIIDWQLGKKKLPKNPCVITFDDGLLDVYRNAVPILCELGLTATFFLIGRTLQRTKGVWLYDLYTIIDSIQLNDCIAAFSHEIENFPLTDQAIKAEIWSWARSYFVTLHQDERTRIIERLKCHFGSTLKPITFMSIQQIRELIALNFHIGSHSMHHECLSKLETDRLEKDIAESSKNIKEIIGNQPKTFCYPFGGIKSWDKGVEDVLIKNDFLCAVSTIEGLNTSQANLFALRRIRVTGNISLPAFVFRILGLRSWLWSLKLFAIRLKRIVTNAR